jgi:hypothetical protein
MKSAAEVNLPDVYKLFLDELKKTNVLLTELLAQSKKKPDATKSTKGV